MFRRPCLSLTPRTDGFTLVELAIVLVIIGLIVGGVLVGVDMINHARMQAASKQINEMVAAHNTYKLKYNAMAGDDANALSYLTGLSGAGNGDGVLMSSLIAGVNVCLSSAATLGGAESEVTWYFQDLAAAGFLNFQFINYNLIQNAFPEYKGKPNTHIIPSCIVPGDNGTGWQGHYYILGAIFNLTPSANVTNTRIRYMVPSLAGTAIRQTDAETAFLMDTKLDDGKPSTGKLRAFTGCSYGQVNYNLSTACESTLTYKFE